MTFLYFTKYQDSGRMLSVGLIPIDAALDCSSV